MSLRPSILDPLFAPASTLPGVGPKIAPLLDRLLGEPGRFADAEIGDLSDEDLAEFERLIEVPDRDLLGWITGEIETPSNYDTSVFRRLKGFHTHTSPIHI